MLSFNAVMAKSIDTICHEIDDYQRTVINKTLIAVPQMLETRTLIDFTTVQSAFTKEAFDDLLAVSARLTDLSRKIGNETITPLNHRISESVIRFARPEMVATTAAAA